MRRIPTLLIVIACTAGMAPHAWGYKPAERYDPATKTVREITFKNIRAGYASFRKVCKGCHYRGNDKNAPFLHTGSRTMKGWNNVFFKKHPQCAKDGSWAPLSEEGLRALNDYLYSEAYDAWDPYDPDDYFFFHGFW